jgi:hypothetical protein
MKSADDILAMIIADGLVAEAKTGKTLDADEFANMLCTIAGNPEYEDYLDSLPPLTDADVVRIFGEPDCE